MGHEGLVKLVLTGLNELTNNDRSGIVPVGAGSGWYQTNLTLLPNTCKLRPTPINYSGIFILLFDLY